MHDRNRQKNDYSFAHATFFQQYPHHCQNGRKEMRARATSRSPGPQLDYEKSEGVDLAFFLPADDEPTLDDSQLHREEEARPSTAPDDLTKHPKGAVPRFSRPQSSVRLALTKSLLIMSQTLSELSGSDVDISLLSGQTNGTPTRHNSLQIPARTRYDALSNGFIATYQ